MGKNKLDAFKISSSAKQDFVDAIVLNVLYNMIANVLEKTIMESVPDTVWDDDLREIKRIATSQLHSLAFSLREQSKKSKK